MSASRPKLAEVELGDPPERWRALGFAVADEHLDLGGVRVRLNAPGRGITGWSITGLAATGDIDGLRTRTAAQPGDASATSHPNGAVGLDHVVIFTPDFERTKQALEQAGMPLRRIRDAGGVRQGFRRLGPAILELVEDPRAPDDGPARFWGLVVIVEDLDALRARLGDLLGEPEPAVQPGRRIATLRRDAALGQPVAFMTPEP